MADGRIGYTAETIMPELGQIQRVICIVSLWVERYLEWLVLGEGADGMQLCTQAAVGQRARLITAQHLCQRHFRRNSGEWTQAAASVAPCTLSIRNYTRYRW